MNADAGRPDRGGSPPDVERRPGGETGAASKSLGGDELSLEHVSGNVPELADAADNSDVAGEFNALLVNATGPEDPQFRAACLLADAWGPALDRSYRLGYENGYVAGFYEAEKREADEWRAVAEAITPVLRMPKQDELRARRGEGR